MTDHPCLTCPIDWKDMTYSDGEIHSCDEDCEKLRALEEGYRAMAEEHRQFASIAINIAHEVLPCYEDNQGEWHEQQST